MVGGGLGSDIVLRHSELGDCKVQLVPHPVGVQVVVFSGEAVVNGQQLAVGTQTVVPLYTPLCLGKTSVALGVPEAAAWGNLGHEGHSSSRSAQPPHSPVAPEAPVSAPAATDAAPHSARTGDPTAGLRPRLMLFMGGLMLMVSAGVGAYSYTTASAPVRTAEEEVSKAEALLRQAGFTQLKAQAAQGSALTITGYLETSAERVQVEKLLARAAVVATLEVGVNDRLVAAVQDVFRANNVAAEALSVGPGAVRLTSHEADAVRLAKVKATALRDIPGLLVLDVNNSPPTIVSAPEPVIEDPGKRVASIVPGDVAYVVTADGSRYFEGALLPTGQRITAIEEGQVRLERNGTSTTVRF